MTQAAPRPVVGPARAAEVPPSTAGAGAQPAAALRRDVEGLRAVAVTVVVLFHAGVAQLPGGYVGVDVFFVISGFLITSLLLREHSRHGRVSIRRFYARRVRRLLPAATLVLGVTAAVSSLLLGAGRARDVLQDGLWASLFSANVRFAEKGTDYLASQAAPSPVQHFWSLAVEEQFYLVWPLLVILVGWAARAQAPRVLGRLLVVVVALSLAWSVYQTADAATWAYFSPFTRAWELAVGALLAVHLGVAERIPRRWAVLLGWGGLLAVAVACGWFSTATAFPGIAAALPVAGTAAVLAAGARPGATGGSGAVLALPPLQWIGQRSYSWYLWHWPMLVLAAALAGRELSVREGLVVSGLSLVVAAAAYALVENPLRQSVRLSANVRLSLVVGAALTAGVVLLQLSLEARSEHTIQAARSELARAKALADDTAPLTNAQIVAQVQKSAAATSLPRRAALALPAASEDTGVVNTCQALRAQVSLPAADECVFGAPEGVRTVVLFGDSHATMWQPALERVAARRGWRLVVLTKSACPAFDLTMYDSGRGKVYEECDRWRTAALQRISSLRPDLVAVASNGRYRTAVVEGRRTRITQALWKRTLQRTLAGITEDAGQVALIGDIPVLAQSAPDCLELNRSSPNNCASPVKVASPASRRAAERAATIAAGARYVDVTGWLCTATTCPPVIGDTIAYYNLSHISAAMARKVSGVLADELGL